MNAHPYPQTGQDQFGSEVDSMDVDVADLKARGESNPRIRDLPETRSSPARRRVTVSEEAHEVGGSSMTGDLGTLLLAWRERALLTQGQLADRTGLHVRTIRRLERGAGSGRPKRPLPHTSHTASPAATRMGSSSSIYRAALAECVRSTRARRSTAFCARSASRL
jgi:hypothetical protein